MPNCFAVENIFIIFANSKRRPEARSMAFITPFGRVSNPARHLTDYDNISIFKNTN